MRESVCLQIIEGAKQTIERVIDTRLRLVGMCLELYCTKVFPSITHHFTCRHVETVSAYHHATVLVLFNNLFNMFRVHQSLRNCTSPVLVLHGMMVIGQLDFSQEGLESEASTEVSYLGLCKNLSLEA